MATPVTYAIVHHGASAFCSTKAECTAIVKSYQNLHMDTNGKFCIIFSFSIIAGLLIMFLKVGLILVTALL